MRKCCCDYVNPLYPPLSTVTALNLLFVCFSSHTMDFNRMPLGPYGPAELHVDPNQPPVTLVEPPMLANPYAPPPVCGPQSAPRHTGGAPNVGQSLRPTTGMITVEGIGGYNCHLQNWKSISTYKKLTTVSSSLSQPLAIIQGQANMSHQLNFIKIYKNVICAHL